MAEKIIKTLVLLSAAATAVIRLALAKISFAAGTVRILNITSYIAAAVLLLTAAVWIIIEKRRERKNETP